MACSATSVQAVICCTSSMPQSRTENKQDEHDAALMLTATAAGLRSEAWILQHNLENSLWCMDWARQKFYERHAARSEWLIRQPQYVDLTFRRGADGRLPS